MTECVMSTGSSSESPSPEREEGRSAEHFPSCPVTFCTRGGPRLGSWRRGTRFGGREAEDSERERRGRAAGSRSTTSRGSAATHAHAWAELGTTDRQPQGSLARDARPRRSWALGVRGLRSVYALRARGGAIETTFPLHAVTSWLLACAPRARPRPVGARATLVVHALGCCSRDPGRARPAAARAAQAAGVRRPPSTAPGRPLPPCT